MSWTAFASLVSSDILSTAFPLLPALNINHGVWSFPTDSATMTWERP